MAAAVEAVGKNIKALNGDVSNLDDLDRILAVIKQDKGRLDIVFANAGIAKYAALGEITEELYDAHFDINVKGMLFTVQKALPLMPDGAAIILPSSVVGSKGLGGEQRLCRHQGGGAVLRPQLDHRFEAAPHPCECHQPGLDRHAGLERAARFISGGRAAPQDDCDGHAARPSRHGR